MITTAVFVPTTRAQARRLGALPPKIALPEGAKQARATVGAFLGRLQRRPDLDPYPFFGASSSNDVSEPTLRPGYDDKTGLANSEVIWPFTDYKTAWTAWKVLAKAMEVTTPFPPSDERHPTVKAVKAAMSRFLVDFDKRFRPGGRSYSGILIVGAAVGIAAAIFKGKR